MPYKVTIAYTHSESDNIIYSVSVKKGKQRWVYIIPIGANIFSDIPDTLESFITEHLSKVSVVTVEEEVETSELTPSQKAIAYILTERVLTISLLKSLLFDVDEESESQLSIHSHMLHIESDISALIPDYIRAKVSRSLSNGFIQENIKQLCETFYIQEDEVE